MKDLIDQYYKTSISEYPQGKWNEGFELKVTYHNQLFDTIQLDLYDSYTFFMDKHIGRAEIRIRNLEGMPEIFTSYYEVLEKKLSMGATSQVSRKALMTSGVGAIQAQIAYQYISSVTENENQDLSEMNWLIDKQTHVLSTKDLSDQELILEFNQLLKNQRGEHGDIQFQKFEQQYPEEEEPSIPSDEPSFKSRAPVENEPKTNTVFETVSSFFGFPPSPPMEKKPLQSPPPLDVLNTEDESLKSFPILDTIGSWTMAKETSQVLRAIGKLLVAFVSISP